MRSGEKSPCIVLKMRDHDQRLCKGRFKKLEIIDDDELFLRLQRLVEEHDMNISDKFDIIDLFNTVNPRPAKYRL